MDHSDQSQLRSKTEAPFERAPLEFARALLRYHDVPAAKFAESGRDPKKLAKIARIILEEPERKVLRTEFPYHTIEKCGMLRVCGVSRHADWGFEKLVQEREKMTLRANAVSLLNHESVVGTDEATQYSFMLIPLEIFATEKDPDDFMGHAKICKALKQRYPKFSQESVDASLMAGILRESRRLKLIAKNQKLNWIVLLHRPINDLSKAPTLLRVRFRDNGPLILDTVSPTDDMLWSAAGAFAVLSH